MEARQTSVSLQKNMEKYSSSTQAYPRKMFAGTYLFQELKGGY